MRERGKPRPYRHEQGVIDMRKLSLVIAGILGAGSPLISQAATLGQAQVQSYLSEPLEVRVPLMRSSGEIGRAHV